MPRGTALVAAGQRGSTEELFFLVRGGCRAERTIQLPGGGAHTSELCLLWPKDLAGELGLLERSAHTAEVSVVADTAVEVLGLPSNPNPSPSPSPSPNPNPNPSPSPSPSPNPSPNPSPSPSPSLHQVLVLPKRHFDVLLAPQP